MDLGLEALSKITYKLACPVCGKCNKGLGQFDDNIEFLRNAINYLDNGKRHKDS
jgi:hypothetical protein